MSFFSVRGTQRLCEQVSGQIKEAFMFRAVTLWFSRALDSINSDTYVFLGYLVCQAMTIIKNGIQRELQNIQKIWNGMMLSLHVWWTDSNFQDRSRQYPYLLRSACDLLGCRFHWRWMLSVWHWNPTRWCWTWWASFWRLRPFWSGLSLLMRTVPINGFVKLSLGLSRHWNNRTWTTFHSSRMSNIAHCLLTIFHTSQWSCASMTAFQWQHFPAFVSCSCSSETCDFLVLVFFFGCQLLFF